MRNWDDIVVNGVAWERELSGFLFMWVFGRGLRGVGGLGWNLCFWGESLGGGGKG